MSDRRERWDRAQTTSGEYGSDSEYVRDLIRRNQEQNTAFRALQTAIQNGVASGLSDRTLKETWAEAEQRYQSWRD